MAADPQVSFLEGALAALSKLWPPVVGAQLDQLFITAAGIDA